MKRFSFRIVLWSLLGTVGVGFLSCTTGSRLEVVHDEFGGIQVVATSGIRLVPDSAATTEYVDLNILRVKRADGESNYRLVAEYLGNSWLLIQQGQSLVIEVDGRVMTLSRETGVDQKKVVEKRRVLELATYPIMRKQLEDIAAATSVVVKLKGAERTLSRKFMDVTLEKYREFVQTY